MTHKKWNHCLVIHIFILISQVNVEFFGVCIQENIFDIVWTHLDTFKMNVKMNVMSM
jgi:hypothetical protein